jgi:hypothetical protein
VASGDGLLVFRRRFYYEIQLRTCDVFTGHVTHLPPSTFPNASFRDHHVVLCSVDDAGRSFELLVADMNIWSYWTFSSKENIWSDIRQVRLRRLVPHSNQQCGSYCSAVIGRTVYWPCRVNYMQDWDQILALDADAGDATVMELPPGCSSNRLLLAQVRGQLCVLVQEERRRIAMWTLASSVAGTWSWSRQVVITNMEIERQAGLGTSMYLLGRFGERSGVLILNVVLKLSNQTYRSPRYLIRLDLGTKDETPVVTCIATRGSEVYLEDLFLHEIDLNSLLQSMKLF